MRVLGSAGCWSLQCKLSQAWPPATFQADSLYVGSYVKQELYHVHHITNSSW